MLEGAATRRRADARAAFPLLRGDATSRARARRGNASKRTYSFQTMHGHGLFKRVWCCVVLRGKATQWRVDAPEMGNGETPWMYRKADDLLNRAIGAFERQQGRPRLCCCEWFASASKKAAQDRAPSAQRIRSGTVALGHLQ